MNILKISLCNDPAGYQVFGFLGVLISIMKIVIPIILIVMGTIDLTKAMVASDSDKMKKAQSLLIKRVIAAVIIFFLPAIVSMVMNLAGNNASKGCVSVDCLFTDSIKCITDGREKAKQPNKRNAKLNECTSSCQTMWDESDTKEGFQVDGATGEVYPLNPHIESGECICQ